MAGVIPKYTRARVDAAGDSLIGLDATVGLDQLEEALQVINNWRASHRYPLNALQVTLRGRAKQVDPNAVVPQRLKR